jgi:hypothetical protein
LIFIALGMIAAGFGETFNRVKAAQFDGTYLATWQAPVIFTGTSFLQEKCKVQTNLFSIRKVPLLADGCPLENLRGSQS